MNKKELMATISKGYNRYINLIPAKYEKIIKLPIIITLIVIFQGSFGGLGMIQIPKMLTDLQKYAVVRFFYIFTIALTATQDIEISALCTLIFFIFIYLLKDEEEKQITPFI